MIVPLHFLNFLSSAHMSPTHLSIIGHVFIWESFVWYTALVHYPEIRGCPLFGSRKCTVSIGIAVGTYIHGGPLYGGCPLLGGSVIGGSTVFSKLLFLSCTRGVYISHLVI